MIGLALSGGGVRGSYEVGAYLAFRKCHIKFDGIGGTSIGAFNGAMLAAHKDKELIEFWKDAEVGKILGLDPKLVEKINENDLDLEFCKLSFEAIKSFFINKGIKTDGLQEVLEKFCIEDTLRKSNIDFGLVTYRMKDHKPLELFIDNITEGSLDSYILASCYLPVFKKKKLEDDSYYFDGGIYDNCPVNMLLEKGYDKVYAVDLKSIGFRRKVIDKTKVITISPSQKLSSLLSVKKEDITSNIKMGYYDTLKVLKNYPGDNYIFKKIPKWYLKILNKRYAEDFDNLLKKVEKAMDKENLSYFKVYNFPKMVRIYLRKKR